MAKKQKVSSNNTQTGGIPSSDPVSRENQMISLATNLAEEQLRNGTASAQIISHYLKLGSPKEQLELQKLREENRLLKAKTEAIKSEADMKMMYEAAIKAMRSYSGNADNSEESDESDDDNPFLY